MENNIKIIFWLYKSKKNSKNLVPVYLRVTQNYEHFFKSTGVYIYSSDWDKKAMRIKGTTPEVNSSNATLDALKVEVLQIVNQLSVVGKPFNIHTIQKTLEGNETSQLTIMKIYDKQLSEMKKLKGKDFAPSIIIKYKNTQLRLKQFIKHRYHRGDLYLYELNYQFMSGFEAFLKEIGDIAGIPKNKPVVTHLARKTFACTVALSNGMNIGVLSKILGHNSIKVTLDSYATVIDELMLRSVKELKEKLTPEKERFIITEMDRLSNPYEELLFQITNGSKN